MVRNQESLNKMIQSLALYNLKQEIYLNPKIHAIDEWFISPPEWIRRCKIKIDMSKHLNKPKR